MARFIFKRGKRETQYCVLMAKKKLVVLTGAGISAESGIKTFRDSDGLWEGHDVMEVATPQGWAKNPALVLDFYNQRRAQLAEVEPNAAHFALKELEETFEVIIITQNVDDLHERAGSSNVLHLHGKLTQVRSVQNENKITEIAYKAINLGDTDENGVQLRPHVVWFGEAVPAIEEALPLCKAADVFVVVGTSMVVYPAASLIQYCQQDVPKFVVDPVRPEIPMGGLTFIEAKASVGMQTLKKELQKLA